MSMILPEAERFSFVAQPLPIPGDLRISWRVALILIMLGESRAKRASLAKLHVLNDAVRSIRSRTQLERMLSRAEPFLNWRMRVEPAFGRAIDFVVGEGFSEWTQAAQRSALQLTKPGLASWEAIKKADDVLVEEKTFLEGAGRRVTEDFVSRLLFGAGRDV